MNLLSNSVKFTSWGTVKLLASVNMSDDNKASISFEIKDTGIGMEPDQIKRIFEPFMQADDSVTRKYGGTGLGLAITKNIIELMGGTLKVESIPGVGSKFNFDITFGVIDAVNAPSEKVILNDMKKPNFAGEVLVCEDNSLNQQVICEHLLRVGLNVMVANNGKEGVDIIAERLDKPFDLIFMDIHMPVMDGLETASAIKEMGIETPIVALTANVMSNDLEIYKSNGIPDYLGKPFTSQELWRCLVKYLPVVSVTDVDAEQQTAEDDKSLVQLKDFFVNNNKSTFFNIKQAIENNDIKQAHRIVHTLKSNAGQIGEAELRQKAAILEDLLEKGKEHVADMHMSSLENELNAVLEKLTSQMIGSKEVIIANTEESLIIIGKLEPLLSGRKPECMYMLDEIRSLPDSGKLADFVENFDFVQALTELEKIKEGLR